jgi:RHS repeat-associated protein
LGNIRVSYSLNPADGELKILEENHYYPFGLKHSNYNVEIADFEKDETGFFVILKPVERSEFQYKYNGKEYQDELGLNFYDFGARNYDAAIGRWMNIDPMAGKWQEYSPYNYTLNNPMFFVDPNGEDVYLYYYVKSNNKEDNSMFMNSAMTRATEMLSTMKDGDVFKISFVEDLGSLESTVENDVKELSPIYGGTREVGIFSHAGLDGPIGSKPASKDALYNKGDLGADGRAVAQNSTQLSINGWSKIDFNFINDGKSRANFFGCNTGRDPDGEGSRKSFTTTLSSLANFKDVKVGVQPSSSYPSMFTNVRETNSAMRSGDFKSQTTYMVAAPGLGVGGRWNSTPANPMIQSVNGETVTPFYQAGKSKK